MAWLKGIFIGALVAVDAVLIALLMQPRHGVDSSAITRSSTTAAPQTQAPTTSATTTTPAATGVKPGPPTRLKAFIVALDGKVAWRVTTGSCDSGGAKLQTTTDGGQTWSVQAVPPEVVTRLQVTGRNVGFAVGARADCRLQLYSTSDGGATWSAPQSATTTWALSPKGNTTLLRPGGGIVEPCDGQTVVDFSRGATPEGAVVLCGTGLVRRTTDSGASWTDVADAPGAYAVSAGTGGTQAYVAGADTDCAGVRIWSVDTGGVAALACAKVPVKDVKPGYVSVAVAGKNGWLLVRNDAWRSTDGLKTWKVTAG